MSADNIPDEYGPPDAQPLAPPTRPSAPVLLVPPSRWPSVIGVITIVVASLSLPCGICGLLGGGTAPTTQSGSPAYNSAGPTPATIFAVVAGLASSAVMLAIGIGLLRRRPWSVRVGVVWAVVDIALTIVCSAYSTWEQIGVLGNQLGGMIVPSGITWAGGGCLFGCSVLVGCAFPVFLLIWFTRRKIRDEVATWETPSV